MMSRVLKVPGMINFSQSDKKEDNSRNFLVPNIITTIVLFARRVMVKLPEVSRESIPNRAELPQLVSTSSCGFALL